MKSLSVLTAYLLTVAALSLIPDIALAGPSTAQSIPEPGSLALLATGIIGALVIVRLKGKK